MRARDWIVFWQLFRILQELIKPSGMNSLNVAWLPNILSMTSVTGRPTVIESNSVDLIDLKTSNAHL